jgi:low temperature requirement protein LtrA
VSEQQVEREQPATPIELFFDLVFAFTQVAAAVVVRCMGGLGHA